MYQVWTKDEYGDSWQLTEIESHDELKAAILDATKAGREIKLSVPMEFSIDVKIKEVPPWPTFKEKTTETLRKKSLKKEAEDETTEGGPKKDTVAGDPGDRSVRP